MFDPHDQDAANHAMRGAQTTMLRELFRHLLEEGLIEPSKAGAIVQLAADENFRPERSTGEVFDLGRQFLEHLARTYAGFPPYPQSAAGGGSPRKDLG